MLKKTILLVEDNPDDVELALLALKRTRVRSNVVVVTDGEEALDYLFARGAYADRDAADVPAVILLDLNLPKLNGHAVLERIRKDGRTRNVPVVILSTSDERGDVAESYRCGANSYICKPTDFATFTEIVKDLGRYWLTLNRPAPVPGNGV